MQKTKNITAIIFALVFISFSNGLKSQEFEGEVIYKTKVERPENSNILKDQFEMMFKDMDTIAILYLKHNRFKLVTLDAKTNKPKGVNLFDLELNRSYSYMEGQKDLCIVEEMKMDTLSKPKIFNDLNDTLKLIGKKCHSITIYDGDNGETKIYYSEDYKINVDSIKNMQYGFLESIIRPGALPLKITASGNGMVYNMVFTAIEVKEEPLNNKIFEVPKFKQIMKSPL